MSGISKMVHQPIPKELTADMGQRFSGNTLNNNGAMAAAIGAAARAQHVKDAPHARGIAAAFPSSFRAKATFATNATGYKTSDKNVSEHPVPYSLLTKAFPGKDRPLTFTLTEGTTLFVSRVDTAHAATVFSVPIMNIMQERRARLVADRSLDSHAIAVSRAGMSSDARAFAARLHTGTTSLLELTSESPEEFAAKWGYAGEIMKSENGATDGSDPMFSVTTPNIGETNVANCFGQVRDNDCCYYLVKEYPVRSSRGNVTTMQVGIQGFSSQDMPKPFTGADQSNEPNDLYYIKKEAEMRATAFDWEWDDELNKPRRITLGQDNTAQEILANIPTVVCDAVMCGHVISVGKYKGRFPTQDTAELQYAALTSTTAYNKLKRIRLWNLRAPEDVADKSIF